MTLQEHWKKYRDAVYPKGLKAVEEDGYYQAFMAGSFNGLAELAAATTGSKEDAIKRFRELLAEAEAIFRRRVFDGHSRN